MRFFFIFLLIILIGTGVFYFMNKKSNTDKISITSTSTIVAFGDSLVYGSGATHGNDFVSQLGKMINHDIINKGMPGDTTAEGLARLDDIIQAKPDIVFVLFGGNDALRNIPKEETFSNLDTMVTTLQQAGAEVVLIGIQGGLFSISDPYAASFENLAEKRGVLLVPNVMEGIFGNKELMSDLIHPNDAGYRMIAQKVHSYLK
jgi:lysophospholipase L1-like esterase